MPDFEDQPLHPRDHVQGSAKAPALLVEYGDYECPYCREAHVMVTRLRKSLGSKLRYAFRQFPLTEIHPSALMAAEAAEAAGLQGKFWEMHDALMQPEMPLTPDAIVHRAHDLGLDMKAFQAAIEEGRALAKIREDRAGALRQGVKGTPTFFVNGSRFPGVPEYSELEEALRSATRG